MNARPFLKWAGGKGSLLPELLKRVPPSFNAYHEPFLGGGALFFALQALQMRNAFLGDTNAQLITTYRAVRNEVDGLVMLLKGYDDAHKHTSEGPEAFYYEVRNAPHSAYFSDVVVAAKFIYLNKTGFNGLYRVNKSGAFNVPFGRYKNPTICDEENLRACARALALPDVHIVHDDFRNGANISPGDLWYADPPYVPLSKSSNFTGYTTGGFGQKDQIDLRDLALTLKQRGVHVMLSNAGSDIVEKLYAKDFKVEAVKCRRNINSKGDGRSEITEYIIT